MFVIDTSITMAWCFEDEATIETDAVLDRLRDESVVAPAIWPLEVANVLLVAGRRSRLTEAQASRFVQLLEQLPIAVEDSATDIRAVIAAGRAHSLGAYDAAYLELAARQGIPLATLDRRLAAAAADAGVELVLET